MADNEDMFAPSPLETWLSDTRKLRESLRGTQGHGLCIPDEPLLTIVGDQTSGKSSAFECTFVREFITRVSSKMCTSVITKYQLEVSEERSAEVVAVPQETPDELTVRAYRVGTIGELHAYMVDINKHFAERLMVPDMEMEVIVRAPRVLPCTVVDFPGFRAVERNGVRLSTAIARGFKRLVKKTYSSNIVIAVEKLCTDPNSCHTIGRLPEIDAEIRDDGFCDTETIFPNRTIIALGFADEGETDNAKTRWEDAISSDVFSECPLAVIACPDKPTRDTLCKQDGARGLLSWIRTRSATEDGIGFAQRPAQASAPSAVGVQGLRRITAERLREEYLLWLDTTISAIRNYITAGRERVAASQRWASVPEGTRHAALMCFQTNLSDVLSGSANLGMDIIREFGTDFDAEVTAVREAGGGTYGVVRTLDEEILARNKIRQMIRSDSHAIGKLTINRLVGWIKISLALRKFSLDREYVRLTLPTRWGGGTNLENLTWASVLRTYVSDDWKSFEEEIPIFQEHFLFLMRRMLAAAVRLTCASEICNEYRAHVQDHLEKVAASVADQVSHEFATLLGNLSVWTRTVVSYTRAPVDTSGLEDSLSATDRLRAFGSFINIDVDEISAEQLGYRREMTDDEKIDNVIFHCTRAVDQTICDALKLVEPYNHNVVDKIKKLTQDVFNVSREVTESALVQLAGDKKKEEELTVLITKLQNARIAGQNAKS